MKAEHYPPNEGEGAAVQEKDNPGVIAPPPLIYLAGLATGFVLEQFWPIGVGRSPAAGIIGIAFGAALMALGLREFKMAETDYLPYRPTVRIIQTGPFRFTRNPLYLAMTLIYAGIALAFGSLWAFLLLVPVLAVIHYGVIAREERYLERKFGEDYLTYKRAVRRWL